MTYHVMCVGCGMPVAGGIERPNELTYCGIPCAIRHGAPDEILRRLRELETAAKK